MNPREEIIRVLHKLAPEVSLDRPKNEAFGDYTTNIAMILAKKSGGSPSDIANDLVQKLKKEKIQGVGEVNAIGGFINFKLSEEYLLKNISKVLEKGDRHGKSGKKIIVEYSSPNIAKPFTIGHLRSTIIGDAVANLLKEIGHEVIRDNHLGDWGTQFGKQIYAIKTWGDEKEIEKAENPVKELVALYVKFHEEAKKDPSLEDEARAWFKRLEDGDSEARILWEKCVEWSLKEFRRIYQALNVSFDTEYGESFFEDKMDDVVKELKNRKLLKINNGAQLVFFEGDKFPPLMILKSDGATLYATRDLATDKFRLEKYGKDTTIINEVGSEQSLYFKQLFEIEKMLGWVKEGQRIHVIHGLYSFKDQKMSTRRGNIIWLEDVLDEAEKRAFHLSGVDMAFEESEVISRSTKKTEGARKNLPKGGITINNMQAIGIGALKWNDLKRNHIQDIVFDWDEILNMQGNSGPYIQYAYVRTQSVLAKSQSNLLSNKKDEPLSEEDLLVLRTLNSFEDVVEEAASSLAPNLLCAYLFILCQRFNLLYQKHQILGNSSRLKITEATGKVIKKGLDLLGIEAPKGM